MKGGLASAIEFLRMTLADQPLQEAFDSFVHHQGFKDFVFVVIVVKFAVPQVRLIDGQGERVEAGLEVDGKV